MLIADKYNTMDPLLGLSNRLKSIDAENCLRTISAQTVEDWM